MPERRNDPVRQRFPGLSGRFIVDTWRGKVRVRKWPRKRGPSKNPQVQAQRDWFRFAIQAAKRVAPSQQRAAIEATKKTGLYPSDVILKAMSVGIVDPVLPDGRTITQRRPFIEAVMFQGTITRLSALQNQPPATLNTITWPLPDIDTAGMWSAGNPTRLTVPSGVEVVNFATGYRANSSSAGREVIRILRNGTDEVAIAEASADSVAGLTCETGPMIVSEGDYFEAQEYHLTATQLKATGATFFTATILQGA